MQFYALRRNRASPAGIALKHRIISSLWKPVVRSPTCSEVVEALTLKKAKIRDKEDRKLPLSLPQDLREGGLPEQNGCERPSNK